MRSAPGFTGARGRPDNPKEVWMRVSEAMTREVRLTKPRQSIGAAAKVMAEIG